MYLLKTNFIWALIHRLFLSKQIIPMKRNQFSVVIVNAFLIFAVVYSFKRKYILYETSTSMFATINIMHEQMFPLNGEDKYSQVIILCYQHQV